MEHTASGHGPSINPALEDVRFCPRCAARADVDFPRRMTCSSCGYGAYYNPKPVACTIPRDEQGRVFLLRRGFAPGKGLWTFPGGFVDLGESVEQAALRETLEELVLEVTLDGLLGVYSRPQDRVVLVVFLATAHGVPQKTPEATEVRAFALDEIPYDELAFWSTRAALEDLARQTA